LDKLFDKIPQILKLKLIIKIKKYLFAYINLYVLIFFGKFIIADTYDVSIYARNFAPAVSSGDYDDTICLNSVITQ